MPYPETNISPYFEMLKLFSQKKAFEKIYPRRTLESNKGKKREEVEELLRKWFYTVHRVLLERES
jgi:hypothetical protein